MAIISPEQIQAAIDFHGHHCPGLTIGIRAAELCLKHVGHNRQVAVTAVVETDMCGVDAIQFLTGCTFGKGNLIHLDHGKMAFRFYCTDTNQALRAFYDPPAELTANKNPDSNDLLKREALCRAIMEAPLDILFRVEEISVPSPRSAVILESLACEACTEKTMESRTRRFGGRTLCIPCFNQVEQKVLE
ncbi:FmdE family protein [Desulfurispira natronophila]|uniref:Formylmethanofuran dehydrogenase subunit E n=1 Tax=Desulfurispira natronophila TaxID=682562 RepID=A0A7W8DHF8_9BACT|nr:FmdE family protein [Desulfurispira natronophila]MBB5022516.1 formylmethanofuran dehydrogenase subunit E [Desulfurispira natronophila]